MYADTVTRSMKAALDETGRRRKLQAGYNKKNGITPTTIKSKIKDIMSSIYEADYYTVPTAKEKVEEYVAPHEIPAKLKELKKEMEELAKHLEFEKAADLRDRIKLLEKAQVEMG